MAEDAILLHICCAPCGGACVEKLLREHRKITLFYSNSNLIDAEEFEKRLESVRQLATIYDLPLEIDRYDHATWLAWIAGLENEPERGARCAKCFAFNLRRAFEKAAGGNFTTTLTVSPMKNSKTIFEQGEELPGFEEIDFKKQNGYSRSCEIAKANGFYRQNFCGCEFSLSPDRERSK